MGLGGVVTRWFSPANPVGSLALLSLLPLASLFPSVFTVSSCPGAVSRAVRRVNRVWSQPLAGLGSNHAKQNCPGEAGAGMGRPLRQMGRGCRNIPATSIHVTPGETEAGVVTPVTCGCAGMASPLQQALRHPPLLAGLLRSPLRRSHPLTFSTREGLGATDQAVS